MAQDSSAGRSIGLLDKLLANLSSCAKDVDHAQLKGSARPTLNTPANVRLAYRLPIFFRIHVAQGQNEVANAAAKAADSQKGSLSR
jgi:hypothetical protein